MDKSGFFIALEGGEGSGKTTQLALLRERLPARLPGRELVFTKEPGGTPFAEKVRGLILDPMGKEASGKTMFGLFFAARHDHVEKVVLPALSRGAVVICDRYIAATYAYQVVAQECPELLPLFDEHQRLLGRAVPDLTLVLDLDPEIALKRIAARKGQALTHFDAREAAFHEKLREGHREYAERAGKSAVMIAADAPPEKVQEALLAAIRERAR